MSLESGSLEDDLFAVQAGSGRIAYEARDRLVERGAEIVEPLMTAYDQGKVAGHMAFEILHLLGDEGRATLETYLARDDGAGGEALMLLSRVAPVESAPWIRLGLGHRDEMKITRSISSFITACADLPLEPDHPARLELKQCGPDLLRHLESGDMFRTCQAAKCLAMVQAEADVAIPKILVLAQDPNLLRHRAELIRSLGVFGERALQAFDWLLELMVKGDSAAILAIEGFGAAAEPALPIIAELRKTFDSGDPSRDKSVRSLLFRVQKSIKQAVKSKQEREQPSSEEAGISPLEDLMQRREGRDDKILVAHSSAESPSSHALDALRALNDPKLLPEIEKGLAQKPKKSRFGSLMEGLGALSRNADSDRARNLILKAAETYEKRKTFLTTVHYQLIACRIDQAAPLLRSQLQRGLDGELNVDFFPLVDFFAAHPDPESIALIGRLALENNSYEGIHAARTLDGLEQEEAREPLEAILADPDIGYRKDADVRRRNHAIHGLGRLADSGSAPVLIAELEKNQRSSRPLCVWALARIDVAQGAEALSRAVEKEVKELLKRGYGMPKDMPYLVPAKQSAQRHLGDAHAGVARLTELFRQDEVLAALPEAEKRLFQAAGS